MNGIKAILLAIGLLSSSPLHLLAEFVSVVELTDLRGNFAYRVCTDAEKKRLDLQLKAESNNYSKALELTKTQWATMYKNAVFPSSRIKQRTMRVISTTSKRDEAELLAGKMESQKARSISRKKAEEERILKMKATKARRGRRSNSGNIKRQQAKVHENRARDASADKAEELLRSNLSTFAGHTVPFYGPVPPKPKPKATKKK
jgi:hypothetical protein